MVLLHLKKNEFLLYKMFNPKSTIFLSLWFYFILNYKQVKESSNYPVYKRKATFSFTRMKILVEKIAKIKKEYIGVPPKKLQYNLLNK